MERYTHKTYKDMTLIPYNANLQEDTKDAMQHYNKKKILKFKKRVYVMLMK